MMKFFVFVVALFFAVFFTYTTLYLLAYFFLGVPAPSWLGLLKPLICPFIACGIYGLVRVLAG